MTPLSGVVHYRPRFGATEALCRESIYGAWLTDDGSKVTCDSCRAVMASLSRADGAGAVSSDASLGGQEAKADPVSSPSHYRAGSVECIDAIDAALAGVKDPLSGFYVAQVIKYVWRHEQKGKPVEDLKKSRWYLDRLIRRLESANR